MKVEVTTSTATTPTEGKITLISVDRLAELVRGVQKKVATRSQSEEEDAYDVAADVLRELLTALYREAGK